MGNEISSKLRQIFCHFTYILTIFLNGKNIQSFHICCFFQPFSQRYKSSHLTVGEWKGFLPDIPVARTIYIIYFFFFLGGGGGGGGVNGQN